MKTTLGRAAASFTVSAALALTLAACSGEEEPAAVATTAEQTADAEATADAAAPEETPASNEDAAAVLDEYVAAVEETLPGLMEQFDGMYSDIAVEGEAPGTVVYTYTYADEMDAAATVEAMEGMLESFQTAFDTAVLPEMTGFGVTESPAVTYVYLNSDGSEIWSHTFSAS